MAYHLEKIDHLLCSLKKLEIFDRAHLSYINQIFGDQSVRDIIQEIMPKPGKLIFEKGQGEFAGSFHHMFTKSTAKSKSKKKSSDKSLDKDLVCSANAGYQNLSVDKNDNLCQSYSLLSYLQIPFDTTRSADATIQVKKDRQMVMIEMYRDILKNKKFIKAFSDDIVFEENDKLWEDTVDDENPFYIIEKYKN